MIWNRLGSWWGWTFLDHLVLLKYLTNCTRPCKLLIVRWLLLELRSWHIFDLIFIILQLPIILKDLIAWLLILVIWGIIRLSLVIKGLILMLLLLLLDVMLMLQELRVLWLQMRLLLLLLLIGNLESSVLRWVAIPIRFISVAQLKPSCPELQGLWLNLWGKRLLSLKFLHSYLRGRNRRRVMRLHWGRP